MFDLASNKVVLLIIVSISFLTLIARWKSFSDWLLLSEIDKQTLFQKFLAVFIVVKWIWLTERNGKQWENLLSLCLVVFIAAINIGSSLRNLGPSWSIFFFSNCLKNTQVLSICSFKNGGLASHMDGQTDRPFDYERVCVNQFWTCHSDAWTGGAQSQFNQISRRKCWWAEYPYLEIQSVTPFSSYIWRCCLIMYTLVICPSGVSAIYV